MRDVFNPVLIIYKCGRDEVAMRSRLLEFERIAMPLSRSIPIYIGNRPTKKADLLSVKVEFRL